MRRDGRSAGGPLVASWADPARAWGGLPCSARHRPRLRGPLALACILDDPRFDRQGDSRSDYYARLAVQCHLPLAAVEGYLRSHLDERAHKYTDLPLDTRASLTSRGDVRLAISRTVGYGMEHGHISGGCTDCL